jgi:hypothetical protein
MRWWCLMLLTFSPAASAAVIEQTYGIPPAFGHHEYTETVEVPPFALGTIIGLELTVEMAASQNWVVQGELDSVATYNMVVSRPGYSLDLSTQLVNAFDTAEPTAFEVGPKTAAITVSLPPDSWGSYEVHQFSDVDYTFGDRVDFRLDSNVAETSIFRIMYEVPEPWLGLAPALALFVRRRRLNWVTIYVTNQA